MIEKKDVSNSFIIISGNPPPWSLIYLAPLLKANCDFSIYNDDLALIYLSVIMKLIFLLPWLENG